MDTVQKNQLLFALLFIFLPGNLLAASHDISINYLNGSKVSATISVDCTDHNSVCQSTLAFFSGQNKPPASYAMNAQGFFHRSNNCHADFGSITVEQDDKETRLPISINYQELPSPHRENLITRALIAHLHPALINHARKELDQVTEISDYLTGTSKNSETLHLFRPEPHILDNTHVADLTRAVNGEFLVLDIGDSYSMVLTFDTDNTPESVYVLDRWKLYREPAVKTVIDYGDLAGLVLHGMDFIQHSETLLGMDNDTHAHTHFTTLERLASSVGLGPAALYKLTSLLGAGFHLAEIIDHGHGVSEFISGGQKHYLDHHHSMWTNIFGVMHLGHTFFELATERSLPHGIETALAVASFAYHHVPHHYYEYPLSQVIQPVTHAHNKRLL